MHVAAYWEVFMNLVVLGGCGPINTCLINLIARHQPVRHAFRVFWSTSDRAGSRWSRLAHSPFRTIQDSLRRRFHDWIDGRMESQAVNHLVARGIPASYDGPSSSIHTSRINIPEFAQSLQAL